MEFQNVNIHWKLWWRPITLLYSLIILHVLKMKQFVFPAMGFVCPYKDEDDRM